MAPWSWSVPLRELAEGATMPLAILDHPSVGWSILITVILSPTFPMTSTFQDHQRLTMEECGRILAWYVTNCRSCHSCRNHQQALCENNGTGWSETVKGRNTPLHPWKENLLSCPWQVQVASSGFAFRSLWILPCFAASIPIYVLIKCAKSPREKSSASAYQTFIFLDWSVKPDKNLASTKAGALVPDKWQETSVNARKL